MWELCNYLVCMGGSCVIFQNFSIDPVRVKLGECCSYVRPGIGKYKVRLGREL
jgi:hypothetical protein